MSNNKQSSIQWIVGKLGDLESMFNLGIIDNIQYYEEKTKLLEQAKAMHKEEIENAYSRGWEKSVQYEIQRSEEEDAKRFTPRNYYNETFGGNNGEAMDN